MLVVSIVCVSCRDTNRFTVSNSLVIKLVGGCTDCPSVDTVYRWTIVRKDGISVPVNLATTTTGGHRRNLVVRSSVIEAGYAYRFADRFFAFSTEYSTLNARRALHSRRKSFCCSLRPYIFIARYMRQLFSYLLSSLLCICCNFLFSKVIGALEFTCQV